MAGPYAPSALQNYVGIGKEVSRGTPVAPTQWGAYISGVDLDAGMDLNPIKEAGVLGAVTYTEKAGHMPAGAFEILARPSISGRFAAYLLGNDSVGAPVSTVYPHTLTWDSATDYLSVEQNLNDEAVERFQDAVINEITWTCNRDAPVLRMKSSWLGGAPTFSSSPTAESYETETPWLLSEAAFTIDGAGATNVIGFEITTRTLYGVEKLASVTPVYMVKLGKEIDLTIETVLDAVNTGYREVNYGSAAGTAAQVLAKSGAFIASFSRGSAATARLLSLTVPNLDYDSSVYTPLDPGASEATKLTRAAHGREVSGTPLITIAANNLDSVAYV